MGAAITLELSRRGHKVTTFEKFPSFHDRGSSHGHSRMIRKAYFEGDFYVPLLERCYDLWQDLNERSGQQLFQKTGGLFIGTEDRQLVVQSLASAKRYDIEIELLEADEVARRFPALRLPTGYVAVYESGAGILDPEKTWNYMVNEALALGADIKFDCGVSTLNIEAGGVRVVSKEGEIFCEHLVLSAGPWNRKYISDNLGLDLDLVPSRRTLHWFAPENNSHFQPEVFPPNVWEERNGDIFYGFPLIEADEGVKYGFHTAPLGGVDPDNMNREVREDEIREIMDKLQKRIPSLGQGHLRSKCCLYTMTPDHHFAIGALPGHPSIILAGGFSGHGYKFTPVVGEIVADMVEDRSPIYDLSHFDPARL